jgi:chemotaxis regulatin CheY-phosphate phosphatase CheZ
MSNDIKSDAEQRILEAVARRLELENEDTVAASKLLVDSAPRLVDMFAKVVDKVCESMDRTNARQDEMHAAMKALVNEVMERYIRTAEIRGPAESLSPALGQPGDGVPHQG